MRALAATRPNNLDVGEYEQRRQRVLTMLVFMAAIVVAATATAQNRKGPKPAVDAKLQPRTVKLRTKDGVQLQAYYFPSPKGKEAISVLLVHDWQGQASPYLKLVLALRDAGCAVLVPDYRGHGSSKDYINARGEKDTFNIAQMSKRDVESIVTFDLEKAKGFLKDENNKENLNLNALVVIGVREGCVLAAHWAQRDWGFPSVGSKKQGQDVKALVLISPEKQVKGIGIDPTLNNHQLIRLPMMIIAGSSSPDAAEARRIGKRVEGLKKRIGRGEASGFQLKMIGTNLSGPVFVNEAPGVVTAITSFVTSQVKITEDVNPWVKRD